MQRTWFAMSGSAADDIPHECNWSVSTKSKFSATPDHIDVWRIPLAVSSDKLTDLAAQLCSDERQRANRFLREEPRQRFIVGRAQLRRILAKYMKVTAAEIRFEYEPLGKPQVAPLSCETRIRFNLSQSGNVALLGVGSNREVGIDVELIRPVRQAQELAQRYFSSSESKALRELPSHQHNEAFLRLWTCKEAFLKALGCGLSFPLDQVTINMDTINSPHIQSVRGTSPQETWQLTSLTPGPDYIGALASPGPPHSISCWRCPD